MQSDAHQVLRRAIYRLLSPLARVMLRHGLAYGSFAEIARKAYVEESLDQLRRSGKRPSISSVAAMTGLTRKEASRLASLDFESGGENDQRYNRAVRVITAWSVDPRFTDAHGEPRPLPVDGEASFASLVKDYSGDVPAAAMLTILEGSGTVERRDNEIRLLDRAYLPTATPVDSLNILGNDVSELLTSIDHNLVSAPPARVFQRKVSNDSIRPEALQAFRDLSNKKSQELLEEYDAWLSQNEVSETDNPSERPRYVAVGIYYFDNTLHEGDDT